MPITNQHNQHHHHHRHHRHSRRRRRWGRFPRILAHLALSLKPSLVCWSFGANSGGPESGRGAFHPRSGDEGRGMASRRSHTVDESDETNHLLAEWLPVMAMGCGEDPTLGRVAEHSSHFPGRIFLKHSTSAHSLSALHFLGNDRMAFRGMRKVSFLLLTARDIAIGCWPNSSFAGYVRC